MRSDWKKLEPEFRRKYLVFGHQSGLIIDSLEKLHFQQAQLLNAVEENRPLSFVGYTFNAIQRISFYAVADDNFAHSEVYELNPITKCWSYSLRVP